MKRAVKCDRIFGLTCILALASMLVCFYAPTSSHAAAPPYEAGDILASCKSLLADEDVAGRKLIEQINSDPTCTIQNSKHTSIESLRSALYERVHPSLTAYVAGLVRQEALKQSAESFFAFALTRTLNPTTHKPYDINNPKDIARLKMKICGLAYTEYDGATGPTTGLCKNKADHDIIEAAWKTVKKKQINFQGQSRTEWNTTAHHAENQAYGFTAIEMGTLKKNISDFNRTCAQLKSRAHLSEPRHPAVFHTGATGYVPPSIDELRSYDQKLKGYHSAQKLLTQKLQILSSGSLSWLFLTDSFRKSVNLDGYPSQPESYCEQSLKIPSPQATQLAIHDFQKLQLADLAERKRDQVASNSLEHFVQYTPQAVREVLRKNPSRAMEVAICRATQSVYSGDQVRNRQQKIIVAGGLLLAGASIATGLGAPASVALMKGLLVADAMMMGMSAQNAAANIILENAHITTMAQSGAVGQISGSDANHEIQTSLEKKHDAKVQLGMEALGAGLVSAPILHRALTQPKTLSTAKKGENLFAKLTNEQNLNHKVLNRSQQQVAQHVQAQPVKKIIHTKTESKTLSFFVELEDGTTGIFKPEKAKKLIEKYSEKSFDYANSTHATNEVIASSVDEIFNIKLKPGRTVIKEVSIDGEIYRGSFSVYAPKMKPIPGRTNLSKDANLKIEINDMLIDAWDHHAENILKGTSKNKPNIQTIDDSESFDFGKQMLEAYGVHPNDVAGRAALMKKQTNSSTLLVSDPQAVRTFLKSEDGSEILNQLKQQNLESIQLKLQQDTPALSSAEAKTYATSINERRQALLKHLEKVMGEP